MIGDRKIFNFAEIILDILGKLGIIFLLQIEDLCNGSTPDSDSVCGGSNPSSSAKKQNHTLWVWFCFL